MLWRISLISTIFLASLHADLLPERFGNYNRESIKPATVTDRPVWEEYGFDQAERAVYKSGGNQLTATAYRLKDPTGALAAFQWLRPSDAAVVKPGEHVGHAVASGNTTLMQMGNYVLSFEGNRPSSNDLKQIFAFLPRYDQSSLPALTSYVPARNLVTNSERYVLGPVSLQKFEPKIPPSIAAFHMGAEAQLARFRTKNGESQLAIFSYPTPQIARERLDAFQKIEGIVAKRTGPLVAAIVSPPNPDDAERLLAEVKYEPTITWSEKIPKPQGNPGDMLLGICILAGVLIVFSVLVGFFLGGFRVMLARFGIGSAHASFTSLDISRK